MSKVSRRGMMKGLVAGAIVLGFDPTARSWVTEARAAGLVGLPRLDGMVTSDPTTIASVADDWGHIFHRKPVAVLLPASVDDVVKMVRYARTHGIRIASRGTGHTPFGQSQAEAGLVIDLGTLNTIHSISRHAADVDAGVLWRDLLLATTDEGLTPPVLTDFTGLTIGGTLSVGGVNGTSFRDGAQIDNVLELQVVTGEGKLLKCSPSQNADLFNVVLGGLGLCGIIVRATIRLIPARERARTFRVFYPDVASMLDDIRKLAGRDHRADEDEDDQGEDDQGQDNDHPPRINHLRGNAAPGATGFAFFLEATSFYDTPDNPSADVVLAGLNFIPGSLQTDDVAYFDFTDEVFQLVQQLTQAGLAALPHPWLDLFVPITAADTFTASSIAKLDPTALLPGSIVLFYFLRRDRLTRPMMRIPDGEVFFLFDILRTTSPDPTVVNGAIQFNRTLYDQNVALGGKQYVISAVPLLQRDWQRHYDVQFPVLVAAKNKFDPGNVLGAGLGVFPP